MRGREWKKREICEIETATRSFARTRATVNIIGNIHIKRACPIPHGVDVIGRHEDVRVVGRRDLCNRACASQLAYKIYPG